MTRLHAAFDRRAMIVGTALLPFTTIAPAGAAGIPTNAAEFGTLFRRMRYRTDDGVLFWWMTGAKYGQMGNEVKAFHGMEACAIIRITSTASGWSTETLEHIFYTDLETGRPLKTVTNPFTGESIEYKRTPARPFTLHYNSDASFELPSEIGGAKFDSDRNKAILAVNGDEIWISDDATTTLTPADGVPVHSADWSTFRCKTTDLSNATEAFVPASLHLQTISGWQSWMKMDGQPGGLLSRIVGAKVASFDEVPETWRALLAEAHPDIARDPIGSLGPQG